MVKAKVKDLQDKFHWNRVAGNEKSLNRPITLPDINRPGLELAGYFTSSQAKRIVVIGGKEMRYIDDEMDEIDQRRVFEFLTNEKLPASSSPTTIPAPSSWKRLPGAKTSRCSRRNTARPA